MKFHRILIYTLAIILLNACRTDEFEETLVQNPIPGELPVYVTGHLTGLVIDSELQQLANAEVELNGYTTTTDENGIFVFKDVSVLNSGGLVKISKAGYFDGFKFVNIEPDSKSLLKVNMVKALQVGSFDSATGADLDVNGAGLSLPADGYTLADGSPYVGQVNVNAHWYDPTDEGTIAAMPGDLRGISAEGSRVQLTTYGMMAVDLIGAHGEELQLKTDQRATISFPLPANSAAPTSIPMWHLDEETGEWIEEGLAERVGDEMIAEVTHFSFWNCDVPEDFVTLRGVILTRSSGLVPLSGLQVVVTVVDTRISGYGYTNAKGIFSGAVPKGVDLCLKIFSCGALVSVSEIGILSDDTDLGDIFLDLFNTVNITATLVGCDLTEVDNGGALITTENSLDIVTAYQGKIRHVVSTCLGSQVFIQAWNDETKQYSDKYTFDLDGPDISCGPIQVCEGTIINGIQFSLGRDPAIILSDATVSIVDDTFVHIYAETEGGENGPFYIELLYYLEGKKPANKDLTRITMAVKPEQGTYRARKWENLNANRNIEDWDRTNVYQVGDLLMGNSETEERKFRYILEVDQIINSVSVTGEIWVDANEDGIRGDDENDWVFGDMMVLMPGISTQFSRWGLQTYYSDFSFDLDGTFELKGLIPDFEYVLIAESRGSYKLSPYLQGADTTRDCDFYVDQNYGFDQLSWITQPFVIEKGDELTDIGVGIYR